MLKSNTVPPPYTIMKYKIKRAQSFSMIPNDILRSTTLTAKAKVLWCFINGCSEGFDLSCRGIAKAMKEGAEAVNKGLQELEAQNLLIRTEIRGDLGRVEGVEYHIFHSPCTENPYTGKPCTENTHNIKEKRKNIESSNELLSISSEINENETNLNKNKTNLNDSINELWELSPKLYRSRTSKAQVKSALQKQMKNNSKLDEIINGYKAYLSQKEQIKENGKYCVALHRFILRRMWVDLSFHEKYEQVPQKESKWAKGAVSVQS